MNDGEIKEISSTVQGVPLRKWDKPKQAEKKQTEEKQGEGFASAIKKVALDSKNKNEKKIKKEPVSRSLPPEIPIQYSRPPLPCQPIQPPAQIKEETDDELNLRGQVLDMNA